MRDRNFLLLILVFTVFLNACNTENQQANGNDSSYIEGSYLGQKFPGLIGVVA